MISMTEKRTALASFVTTVLEAHRASLNIETRYKRAVDMDASSKLRQSVMGSPVWYAELLHTGPDEVRSEVESGIYDIAHTFTLSLFLEYADTDARATEWDNMLHAETGTEGLMPAFYDADYETAGSGSVQFNAKLETDDILPLAGDRLAAHFAVVTIQVTEF